MNPSDYILVLRISERGLAEGKRPPLCDGCNSPFQKDELTQSYNITALILDGETFYGLECEQCITSYFRELPVLREEEVDKSYRLTIRRELAQEMTVVFSDF